MTKLSEYRLLAEKDKYFTNGRITCDKEVWKVFEELEFLHKQGDFSFRGCTEAKYKIYSSAQRFYTTNELYKQASNIDAYEIQSHFNNFVSNMIEECKLWNGGNIEKLLNAMNIKGENSLAYLSYMQHYGIPAPLIDFTENPYVAAFFAVDSLTFCPSDREIDNYFSIYALKWDDRLLVALENHISKRIPEVNNGNIPYSEICEMPFYMLRPTDETYKIINNANIINQEGGFCFNPTYGIPLETQLRRLLFDHKAVEEVKDQHEADGYARLVPYELYCFNIHKSLKPVVLNILNSKGVNRDFVYPDTVKMKENVIFNAVNKSFFDRSES